jgi:hypothetical protein
MQVSSSKVLQLHRWYSYSPLGMVPAGGHSVLDPAGFCHHRKMLQFKVGGCLLKGTNKVYFSCRIFGPLAVVRHAARRLHTSHAWCWRGGGLGVAGGVAVFDWCPWTGRRCRRHAHIWHMKTQTGCMLSPPLCAAASRACQEYATG